MRDLSFDPLTGTLLSIPLCIFLLWLGLLPYRVLWNANPIGAALQATTWVQAFLIFAGGIVVHELIHALTWMWAGGLRFGDIKFGFSLKGLAPYAHAKRAMPAGAYKLGVAMPALLTGLLPVLLGTASGRPLLACFGAIFLSAAGGDLLVFLRILRVDNQCLLTDHPRRVGAQMVTDE